MVEEFGPVLASLRRVFPHDELETLSDPQLAALRSHHPSVPEHYLAFLREVGHGALDSSLMLYSGLVKPEDIFDSTSAAELNGLLFFGDHFDGDMVGFDTRDGWRLIEVWHSSLTVHPIEAQTIAEWITRKIRDWEG